MNIFGIGPRLAIVGGSSLAVIVILQQDFRIAIALPSPWREYFQVVGIFIFTIGIYFWVSSIVLISQAYKFHKLETSGVYRFSRNPLYAAFIVFFVPGIALICNNILIFIVSLALFITFKSCIRKEEEYLRRKYGVEFQQYEQNVSQLIPFVRI